MTRFEVYRLIADWLNDENLDNDFIDDLEEQEGREFTQEERRLVTNTTLEVINALNFCIRYNWPINTYFKERKQHDAAD